MDFAATPETTKYMLGIDDASINWLYTVSLMSTVPSVVLTLAFIDYFNRLASCFGVASTMIAAWVRYEATKRASFDLAVVSGICLGLGTGFVFVGFTQIPRDWFPSERERSLAMALAVQVSFLGWAFGGLIIPMFVTSVASMISFSYIQAVSLTVCFFVFLAWHRSPISQDECLHSATTQPTMMKSMALIIGNGRFLVQSCACAMFQGVGFTIPAILFDVLEDQGYGSKESAWMSFAFIMGGVIAGLTLGEVVSRSASPNLRSSLLLSLFWKGSVAVWLLFFADSCLQTSGEHSRHIVIFVLMMISGSCSLGFVNVALPVICETASPVSESLSGGLTELLGFAMGAFLTQASSGYGFSLCAVASLFASILMSTSFSDAFSARKSSSPGILAALISKRTGPSCDESTEALLMGA